MKKQIAIYELRVLILEGISSEELNTKYDYSNIISMYSLFSGCHSLKTIPYLDTSNVKDMSFMFHRCHELETLPELDVSNVTNMTLMFHKCYNLKNINPYNYSLYDFSELDNKFLKEKYPELYI